MVSALLKHSTSLDQPCQPTAGNAWSHQPRPQGPKDLRALLLNLGSTVYPRRVWGHVVRCCRWVQSLWCVGTANPPRGQSACSGGCCVRQQERAIWLHVSPAWIRGSRYAPNRAGHLPSHRAAYEGHSLALKYLIPVTSKYATRKAGQHQLTQQQVAETQCLELLVGNCFVVNTLPADHISESYDGERLHWIWLFLMMTSFHRSPSECSAIQYALNDRVMLRLLLKDGYRVELSSESTHRGISGNAFVWSETEAGVLPGWTSCGIKGNRPESVSQFPDETLGRKRSSYINRLHSLYPSQRETEVCTEKPGTSQILGKNKFCLKKFYEKCP